MLSNTRTDEESSRSLVNPFEIITMEIVYAEIINRIIITFYEVIYLYLQLLEIKWIYSNNCFLNGSILTFQPMGMFFILRCYNFQSIFPLVRIAWTNLDSVLLTNFPVFLRLNVQFFHNHHHLVEKIVFYWRVIPGLIIQERHCIFCYLITFGTLGFSISCSYDAEVLKLFLVTKW